MNIHYDIVIVGGGLVGASLALALQNTPYAIALVDARIPTQADQRLFALSNYSCEFLQQLSIWQQLAHHAAPIRNVHVSYKKRFGALRFNASDLQLPQLGHVVPAHYIEEALASALEKQKNLTSLRGARLEHITSLADGMQLSLQKETENLQLTTHLLIGADGTESSTRKLLNIPTQVHDYGETAIVTRTLLATDHHGVAYERCSESGVIAMLPLIGRECATIWSCKNTYAKTLLQLSDADFLQKLQQTFGTRLGELQKTTTRYHYPLRCLQAKKNYHDKTFLIGNAAHTLHPIAAQGFNVALTEVKLIAEKLAAENKISDSACLALSAHIIQQQKLNIDSSHYLARLFATPPFLASILAPIGFAGLSLANPIKNSLLKRLIGMKNPSSFILKAANE